MAGRDAVKTLSLFPDEPERGAQHAPNEHPTRGSARPSTDPEEFARWLLAIAQIKGIGVHALRALIDYYGELRHVADDDEPTIRDVLARAHIRDTRGITTALKGRRSELLAQGERERERLAGTGIQVIGRDASSFPERLRDLPDAPYWLFVAGDTAALNGPPLVAVVGTREASPIGVMAAKRLAHLIVMDGLSIVSGLAEGIDAAAQGVAALYRARQVAVLGTGIEVVFPASTAGLRRRIIEAGGAVISEYLPGDSYGRARFVERNRIQAALAAAVCPVEGRSRSGTAHTVRFATQYGRPLFGVQRGPSVAGNELLGQLAELQAPIFDLATTPGVQALQEFLGALAGPRWPVPKTPDYDVVFDEVFAALDRVLTELPANNAMGQWLVRRIAQRFGLPQSAGGTET